MRSVALSVIRRALAVLVLVVAVVLAIWTALFKVWYPLGWNSPVPGYGPPALPRAECSTIACYGVRPEWTLPVAVALGLVGISAAALLYRPRPISR